MLLLVVGLVLVFGGLLLRVDLFHDVPNYVRLPVMAAVAVVAGIAIAVLPVVLFASG